MRNFLKYLLLIISPSLLLIILVLTFVDPKNYYSDLELFQNEKIKLINNHSTIFFGDSSCGNGVDAKLFGKDTYNLSLTGSYITCGSLAQLNELIKEKKIPERIFLMYTIDVYNRNSIPGYKLNNKSFKDFFTLKFVLSKIWLKKLFLKLKNPN